MYQITHEKKAPHTEDEQVPTYDKDSSVGGDMNTKSITGAHPGSGSYSDVLIENGDRGNIGRRLM